MIAWTKVKYTASDRTSSIYLYELFYNKDENELFEVLTANQFEVEHKLNLKITISYENERLYLTAHTNGNLGKDELIEDIMKHYKILSSKPQPSEKFLNRIQQINLCSRDGKNYMQAIIKHDSEIVEIIFEVLKRRGAKLNLEVEKRYDKKAYFITLTPINSATMDELLVQKAILLSSEENFYSQCDQITNKPKKTEVTLSNKEPTFKNPPHNKQKRVGKITEVHFPLSGTFNYLTTNYPRSEIFFTKEKVPHPQFQTQPQTQPKKPVEVVDLTEEKNSSKFSSKMLNETSYKASDLKIMEMQPSIKRKATEFSQANKVQKTSEDSQSQNLNNVDEAQEFIDSIFSDQFNFQS